MDVSRIPEHIDVDGFVAALMEVFPAFGPRLELLLHPQFQLPDHFLETATMKLPHPIPTLALISLIDHPLMTEHTGGARAEQQTRELFPHASFAHVPSDHIEIPYTIEATRAVARFMVDLLPARSLVTASQTAAGEAAFARIRRTMVGVRTALLDSWARSRFASDSFCASPGTYPYQQPQELHAQIQAWIDAHEAGKPPPSTLGKPQRAIGKATGVAVGGTVGGEHRWPARKARVLMLHGRVSYGRVLSFLLDAQMWTSSLRDDVHKRAYLNTRTSTPLPPASILQPCTASLLPSPPFSSLPLPSPPFSSLPLPSPPEKPLPVCCIRPRRL